MAHSKRDQEVLDHFLAMFKNQWDLNQYQRDNYDEELEYYRGRTMRTKFRVVSVTLPSRNGYQADIHFLHVLAPTVTLFPSDAKAFQKDHFQNHAARIIPMLRSAKLFILASLPEACRCGAAGRDTKVARRTKGCER